MNLIKQIQIFFGNFILNNELPASKRDIIVNNIDSVSLVGMLFDATKEENYRHASKFALLLKKEGVKEVKMLGFVDAKDMPPSLSPKLGQDFFMKKDLNWYLKPGSTAVLNFIHEPFDLLIDLSTENIFPMKYILGKSAAHFKVGKGNIQNDALLDMMINNSENDGIESLSVNILHYLRQINRIDGDVLAMLK